MLQNISLPVMDLLVVLSPAWLASTKQWVNIDLPLGIGISKVIGSQASGYKYSQSIDGLSPLLVYIGHMDKTVYLLDMCAVGT